MARGINDMVDIMLTATNDRMSREQIIVEGLSAVYFAGFRIVPLESPDYARAAAVEFARTMSSTTGKPIDAPKPPAERRKEALRHHLDRFSQQADQLDRSTRIKLAVLVVAVIGAVSAVYYLQSLRPPTLPTPVEDELFSERSGPSINWGGRR